jgi:signal transduction histidine kinase
MSVPRGALWLYDGEHHRLILSNARGVLIPQGDVLAFDGNDAGQLLGGPVIHLLDGQLPENLPTIHEIHHRWPELEVVVPLVSREQLLGILAVGPKIGGTAFDADELEMLHTLATMVASGIHSHRLIQGLQGANDQLRAAQEHLIHQERLAAIGTVASGIAHEIRNPLTSIKGFAATIAEDKGDLSLEEMREYAGIILEESYRLEGIVEEVRSYSKVRGYERTPTPLGEVLDEISRFVRFDRLFQDVDVEVVQQANPVADINRDRMKQVVWNLLRNAAQARVTERRPKIVIRLVEECGHAILSVEDNGSGIPADRLEAIWEPFFTTKGEEGTGLGLNLCRDIVQRHDGMIEVQSEAGVGSVFTITLPLAEGEASDGCRSHDGEQKRP